MTCPTCGMREGACVHEYDTNPTRPQPEGVAAPASIPVAQAAGGADFYQVVPDEAGCRSCGQGDSWTVCWEQDGVAHQISMSSEDQDDIEYKCELMNSARELALQDSKLLRDARRYRRLQVLGCAPSTSVQLTAGTVLCFTNLDEFVDADLLLHPSRGEHK